MRALEGAGVGYIGENCNDAASRAQSGQVVVDPLADDFCLKSGQVVEAATRSCWRHSTSVEAGTIRHRLAVDIVHLVHHGITIGSVVVFSTAVTDSSRCSTVFACVPGFACVDIAKWNVSQSKLLEPESRGDCRRIGAVRRKQIFTQISRGDKIRCTRISTWTGCVPTRQAERSARQRVARRDNPDTGTRHRRRVPTQSA